MPRRLWISFHSCLYWRRFCGLFGHRYKGLCVVNRALSSQVRHQHKATTCVTELNVVWEDCTDLWRLYHVWRGNSHLLIRNLHDKYGSVVRIGPKLLDLDFPELTKNIYNIKGDWLKVLTPLAVVIGLTDQVNYS